MADRDACAFAGQRFSPVQGVRERPWEGLMWIRKGKQEKDARFAAPPMELMERLAEGNREYRGQVFTDADASRPVIPRLRLAVVACMDCRHVPERVLGLEPGDAKVIRSAGAIVDDGVLRSLVAAVHFLDVQNVLVMPHTDCGMRGLGGKKGDLAKRLEASLGRRLDDEALERTLAWLQPFEDPEVVVQESLDRIRAHELLPKGLVLMGSVYDNKTGAVRMLTD